MLLQDGGRATVVFAPEGRLMIARESGPGQRLEPSAVTGLGDRIVTEIAAVDAGNGGVDIVVTTDRGDIVYLPVRF